MMLEFLWPNESFLFFSLASQTSIYHSISYSSDVWFTSFFFFDERRLYQEQVLPEQPCDAFIEFISLSFSMLMSSQQLIFVREKETTREKNSQEEETRREE